MKVQFRIGLGILLLVAIAVAQEAPQDKQQATNAAASRPAASGSTAPKNGTAPNAPGAKPNATLETPILTQQDSEAMPSE